MTHKILVIEDEQHIRETITDILDYAEYDYREARNGLEGVTIATEYLPDLVICDIMMPEMDGYAVLIELQANTSTALTPFIFLTARASHEDIRKGMAMGADDYLTKPFTADELLEAIQTRLTKHKAQIEASKRDALELRNYLSLSLPHELRTPLTGIKGYLDIMLLDFDMLEKHEIASMLMRMASSANRLHRLVENHVLYAQLRLEKSDPEQAKISKFYGYCNNTREILTLVTEQIASKHRRIDDLLLTATSASIVLSTQKFQTVVYELVDNAFKFSKSGSPVTVDSIVEDDMFTVTINDRGIGMKPEEIQRIGANQQFNREIHEQQGNGLGLAIAREVIEQTGGNIEITSSEADGTTVQFSVPLNN